MTVSDMLIEETTGVVRNLVSPIKISDDKKTTYISSMVDEIFLEAYTASCARKEMEIDFGGADPMEIDAKIVHDLMVSKFEFEEILEALTFATNILTTRYLEVAAYSPEELFSVSKNLAQAVKE
jgi:hypothetical protein